MKIRKLLLAAKKIMQGARRHRELRRFRGALSIGTALAVTVPPRSLYQFSCCQKEFPYLHSIALPSSISLSILRQRCVTHANHIHFVVMDGNILL